MDYKGLKKLKEEIRALEAKVDEGKRKRRSSLSLRGRIKVRVR